MSTRYPTQSPTYRSRVATVHQISVSPGGVPKRPVATARIDFAGVEGDRQADTRFHGGPDRAVCLYSLEVIETLRSEGHPIFPGAAGENLTLSGLEWERLQPGDRLHVGDQVLLEVTSFTSPCQKNAAWFRERDFTRMSQTRHPGSSRLYARVLSEGEVAPGDPVHLVAG